jgi:hypothetical protein
MKFRRTITPPDEQLILETVYRRWLWNQNTAELLAVTLKRGPSWEALSLAERSDLFGPDNTLAGATKRAAYREYQYILVQTREGVI